LVSFLLENGGWTMLRQRPYNAPADHTIVPRDIFVSTFDSAPLAPDSNVVIAGEQIAFQKGLDVLKRLTEGEVYLGLDASEDRPSPIFTEAVGVEKYYFQGKHPVGNVGVQIHHIKPLASGDVVWTLGVQEVLTLGNLFVNNRFDASRVVAVAGAESELEEAKYVKTYIGANIGELVKGNVKHDNTRLVSGDVLSGQQKASEQFLNYYDDQITVLAEGDDYELFGWLLPVTPRPSISNTFPNFLFPDQQFVANTNTHGEKRAFVVSSDYEQVMPMDVYVQPLMKAIMVNDFERMEGLGLTELVEEDVALCEFVCTSKMPLQKILREGLDEMRAQG
ncbi:MAG: NADH:ubiquinone reductase (Na(+)-transporting) subunit A, partial [Bacteroidota bacterium]